MRSPPLFLLALDANRYQEGKYRTCAILENCKNFDAQPGDMVHSKIRKRYFIIVNDIMRITAHDRMERPAWTG